jgi:aspartyl protease family protein
MAAVRVGATDVRVVAVTPGRSADVVIDDRAPITIEAGQTIVGVTVVRVDAAGAVVRIDGATRTLALAGVRAGEHAITADAGSITLPADTSGHFFAKGEVNGKPLHFIVDTGATLVALSRTDAARAGIDYARGKPALSRTANGVAKGWLVTLQSVRVGSVTVRDVDAMVMDGDLPSALLGMSFLGRFDMQQHGTTLVLRRNAR